MSTLKEVNKNELDNFKNALQVWLQLDTEVEKLQDKIKEYKKQKEKLSPLIMDFMKEKGHNTVAFSDGVIKYKVSKVPQTLSRQYIADRLKEFLKDENKADNAVQYLLENRKVVERVKLERKSAD
jgi:uncharacterized membrane protein YheB (UPF0754 family)